jgi:hypothetical protein
VQLLLDDGDPHRLVARLEEGRVEAVVTASHPAAAAAALVAAIDEARASGYGECFWHEQTGQYWWMLQHDAGRLEVVVLWSSGTVTGWQHVFRAADALDWFAGRVQEELVRIGLADPV